MLYPKQQLDQTIPHATFAGSNAFIPFYAAMGKVAHVSKIMTMITAFLGIFQNAAIIVTASCSHVQNQICYFELRTKG